MTKPPENSQRNVNVLTSVMATATDLTRFGLGVYGQSKKSLEELRHELEIGRQDMLSNDALAEFDAARLWLRQFPKIKAANTTGTSYGLKHVAEPDIGYTSNGMFIAAALAEGFRITRLPHGGPNVFFNISSKAWRTAATRRGR